MLMVCNVLVMMIVFVDTKVAVDESNAELEAERETAMLGAASASELVMEEGAADDEAGGDAGGGVEMVTVVTDQVNPILKESVPPPAPSASLAPPPTPATAAPTVVVATLPLEVTDEISIDLGHGDREQAPITGRRSSISNHVSWRTEMTTDDASAVASEGETGTSVGGSVPGSMDLKRRSSFSTGTRHGML